MDLLGVLDQVREQLQRRGRLTYRMLKVQFNLDEESLETLKEELLYAHPEVASGAPGTRRPWRAWGRSPSTRKSTWSTATGASP